MNESISRTQNPASDKAARRLAFAALMLSFLAVFLIGAFFGSVYSGNSAGDDVSAVTPAAAANASASAVAADAAASLPTLPDGNHGENVLQGANRD